MDDVEYYDGSHRHGPAQSAIFETSNAIAMCIFNFLIHTILAGVCGWCFFFLYRASRAAHRP